MKRIILFSVIFLVAENLMAQMQRSDMHVTGAWQPDYLWMDAVRANKISYIRETTYNADTLTGQVDMSKPYRIGLYGIAYFGNTPLLVKNLAVMGTDTNNLVRNEVYTYNPANGLLTGYQTASNEDGLEIGTACQVERDAGGLVVAKASGYTFNLKESIKPRQYKVRCNPGQGNQASSVRFMYTKDGKELYDGIFFEYDTRGNMTSARFSYGDRKDQEEETLAYDANGRLTEDKWSYTRPKSEYHAGSEGTVAFGIYIPPTASKVTTTMATDTKIISYTYDEQGRLSQLKIVYNDKQTYREKYSYNSKGLPETINVFDAEDRLTALKKISCQ